MLDPAVHHKVRKLPISFQKQCADAGLARNLVRLTSNTEVLDLHDKKTVSMEYIICAPSSQTLVKKMWFRDVGEDGILRKETLPPSKSKPLQHEDAYTAFF